MSGEVSWSALRSLLVRCVLEKLTLVIPNPTQVRGFAAVPRPDVVADCPLVRRHGRLHRRGCRHRLDHHVSFLLAFAPSPRLPPCRAFRLAARLTPPPFVWSLDSLNVAFGLCVSLIFIWAILWGLLSYAHVHWALKRERAWWRTNYATLVVPNLVRRPEDDRGEAGTERLGAAQGAGVKGPGKTGPGKTGRHRGSSIHTDLRLPTNSGFPPSSTWSTSAPDQVAPVTRTTVGRVSEDRELERARIPDAADDGDDGRGSASTTTIVGGGRSSAETTYSSGKDGAVSPSQAKAGAPSAVLEAAPAEADPVEQNGRIV